MIDEIHSDFNVYQSAPRQAHESVLPRAQVHNPIKGMKTGMFAFRINQYCSSMEGHKECRILQLSEQSFRKTHLWPFQSKAEHISLVSPVEQHARDTVSTHTQITV